jgi:CBS-domain-containing membrane protein
MVDDKEVIVCSQPHCVLLDFQMVNLEKLPTDDVGSHMTVDPITVMPTMPVRQLALRMVDAHLHEVFVIDEDGKPIGRVTAADLLAAMMEVL